MQSTFATPLNKYAVAPGFHRAWGGSRRVDGSEERRCGNRRSRPGFALVLVLAMLVLVAGLVTAYFSRALQDRRVGSASTGDAEVVLLAQSATGMILDDLFSEMEAGSEVLEEHGVRIFQPLLVPPTDGEGVPLAPSMAPQHVDPQLSSLPAVVKTSRHQVPFYELWEGYENAATPGAARASGVGTAVPALRGNHISRGEWNRPGLMTPDEFAEPVDADAPGFRSPDWIYVNRMGENPDPDEATLALLRNAAVDNPDFVLGRFAYVIYDVGGLLDINVAGNALDAETNAHRGRPHQVDPSIGFGLDNGEAEGFADFLAWRGPELATEEEKLFEATRTFLEVETGDQAFVNRMDLLRYVEDGHPGIYEEALPYLTVYSRAVNAPHWRPDPDRELDEMPPPHPSWNDPGVGDPEVDPLVMNPDLISVRFPVETTLSRGTGPELSVSAGTPVMPRRFPLGKLELFNEENPDPDDLLYYFGLEKVSGEVDVFEYAATTEEGRIARLEEVAGEGREPNFFEVLQAVILTGSLGKTGGHSYTFDMFRDRLRNLQILQIGANIIDQWDSDDIPTTIRHPDWDPLEVPWLEVYGTENLPYLHRFSVIPYRPEYDPERFQLWAVFDVWNPHRNAATLPEGIEAFRIHPVAGEWDRHNMFYTVRDGPVGNWGTSGMSALTGYARGGERHIGLINEEWFGPDQVSGDVAMGFHFPVGTYPEVTTLGIGAPEREGDGSGLLLWDFDLNEHVGADGEPRVSSNPGIPSRESGLRHPDVQLALNDTVYYLVPFRINGEILDDPGDYRFPAGTEITFESQNDSTYWTIDPALPETNITIEETELYANYEVKDRNAIGGLSPSSSHPWTQYDFTWLPHHLDPENPMKTPGLRFVLQARVDGEWVTYQRIDDYFQRSAGNPLRRGARRYSDSNVENYMRDRVTHHHGGDEFQANDPSYYDWDPVQSYMRYDPRGHRFGFNDAMGAGLGEPLRSSTGYYDTRAGWVRFRIESLARGVPVSRVEGGSPLGFEQEGTEGWYYGAAGMTTNSPDVLDEWRTVRYPDRDGVIRPADAYFGEGREVLPTVPGRFEDRPVILNRPFRSPADLGFVFRDLPWKSLDFATRHSADLGLLDVFSLDESLEETPLVAGRINLNTGRPEVLRLAMENAVQRFDDIHPDVEGRRIGSGLAAALATRLVEESRWSPFRYPGDMVSRVFHRENADDPLDGLVHKEEREAALRALAAVGQTRTWNLMIDVIVQSGRFTAASQTGADFMVGGERRYWLHVAIDRMTGEILDLRKEKVLR